MIVKVHSFAEEGSNRPRLVEGRLPRKAGECLVEPLFLEKSGLSIGGHHPPGHRDRRL